MHACFEHPFWPVLDCKPLEDARAAISQLLIGQKGHQGPNCVLFQQRVLAVGLLGKAMQLPELIGAPILVRCHLHASCKGPWKPICCLLDASCRALMHSCMRFTGMQFGFMVTLLCGF